MWIFIFKNYNIILVSSIISLYNITAKIYVIKNVERNCESIIREMVLH